MEMLRLQIDFGSNLIHSGQPISKIPLRSDVHNIDGYWLSIVEYSIVLSVEVLVYSLVNFYCQYADTHMNLKFMRHVSK